MTIDAERQGDVRSNLILLVPDGDVDVLLSHRGLTDSTIQIRVIERRKQGISERAYFVERNIEVLVKLKQVGAGSSSKNIESEYTNKFSSHLHSITSSYIW